MAWFTAKEWKNRLVEFAGRRSLKNVSTNETAVYDVTRNEGQVSQEGDSFSATTMNDLEQRISDAFAEAEEANTQLSSEILGKAPASDPTLTFQNVGGTGGRVELRKSGGNPYALSLVYTNPSGENTFHSLVDSDGSRLWVMPNELTEVKNSFQAGVNTLYSKCVSCGVTPANQTPAVIANAIQVIHDNRYNEGYEDGQNASVPTRFSAKEVYRNSGWNDGNNYTSVFNSELYNKELYASLLVAVREHVNSGEGSTTTMNEVRYSPSTGEIFVDSVGCYAEHITAYYK